MVFKNAYIHVEAEEANVNSTFSLQERANDISVLSPISLSQTIRLFRVAPQLVMRGFKPESLKKHTPEQNSQSFGVNICSPFW